MEKKRTRQQREKGNGIAQRNLFRNKAGMKERQTRSDGRAKKREKEIAFVLPLQDKNHESWNRINDVFIFRRHLSFSLFSFLIRL